MCGAASIGQIAKSARCLFYRDFYGYLLLAPIRAFEGKRKKVKVRFLPESLPITFGHKLMRLYLQNQSNS